MKNLLEAAIRVGERSQGGSSGQSRQRIKSFQKQTEEYEAEGRESDIGTGGYTSGALSSDDEIVFSSNREPKELDPSYCQVQHALIFGLPLTAHKGTKLLVQDVAQMTMSLWPT